MKKICIYIVIATIAIMLWFSDKMDAFAIQSAYDGQDYPYMMRYKTSNGNLYEFVHGDFPEGAIPFIYIDGWSGYCAVYYPDTDTYSNYWAGQHFYYYANKTQWYTSTSNGQSYMGWTDAEEYESNISLFTNRTDALNYFRNGTIPSNPHYIAAAPMPDWDDPEMSHDFSLDEYNKDIPLPEIYNVNFDTFYVKNGNGYAIDLLIETRLNSVDISKESPTRFSDTGIAFRSNSYNFTQSTKYWYNNGIVNVKDMYDVDIAQWYLDAWRDFVNTYPKYSDLPSYSWLKYGGSTSGALSYKTISDIDTLLANTNNNVFKAMYLMPFQTTYYVRFLNPVNLEYGQWVRVTAKNSSKEKLVDVEGVNLGKPHEVDLGAVDGVGVSGKPIVREHETLKLDYSTESYVPKVEYETGEVDWNMSLSNLKQVTGLFGAFPSFVAVCFSFLPEWITALIGATITVVCALALYHAIRG